MITLIALDAKIPTTSNVFDVIVVIDPWDYPACYYLVYFISIALAKQVVQDEDGRGYKFI